MISLRPYQKDAGNAFYIGMREHQRQVIVLPTGTGKTVLGLAIAKRLFGGGRTLWLSHRTELITQPHRTCGAIWPEANRGIVKAQRDEHDAQIVFASVQTAHRPKRAARLGRFDFVVADEVHHFPSKTFRQCLENVGCFDNNGPKLLGLTATPERADGKSLGDIFDKIAYVYHITEAISDGYLVPVKYEQRRIDLDLNGIKVNRNGDFDETQLDAALLRAGVVDAICDAVCDHQDRKSLVFTVSVAQASDVAEKLKSRGIKAESVDGGTPAEIRAARFRRFSAGDIMCLVNCAIATEGTDVPSIDCIVMGRPTKSKPLAIQCIGRGLRIAPNKTDCLVIDLVGASTHHNLIQAPALFGADHDDVQKEIRRQYEFDPDIAEWNERKLLLGQIKGLQPIARSNMRWVQSKDGDTIAISAGRGGTVIARRNGDTWTVIVAKRNETELLVSGATLELAQGISEDYVRRCTDCGLVEKGAAWRSEAATAKQIKALDRMKRKVAGEITKGEASDMITLSIADDWRHMPATEKQIYALRSKGVDVPKMLTRQQARALLWRK